MVLPWTLNNHWLKNESHDTVHHSDWTKIIYAEVQINNGQKLNDELILAQEN